MGCGLAYMTRAAGRERLPQLAPRLPRLDLLLPAPPLLTRLAQVAELASGAILAAYGVHECARLASPNPVAH